MPVSRVADLWGFERRQNRGGRMIPLFSKDNLSIPRLIYLILESDSLKSRLLQ